MVVPAFDLTSTALREAPQRRETASQVVHQLAQLVGLDLKRLRSGEMLDHSPWASAVAERNEVTFSRWYIRCQFEELATLDSVATVVGLAWETRPNVVILAVVGSVSEEARRFVAGVNRNSTFRFVCLDVNDLLDIGIEGSRFTTLLEQRSSPDYTGR